MQNVNMKSVAAPPNVDNVIEKEKGKLKRNLSFEHPSLNLIKLF